MNNTGNANKTGKPDDAIVSSIMDDLFQNHPDLRRYFTVTVRKVGYNFVVYTITVVNKLDGKRLYDDEIYKEHPELCDIVHRGHHYIYWNNEHISTVLGCKKMATHVDGENIASRASSLQLQIIKSWEEDKKLKVEVTEKVNGQNSQVRVIRVDEDLFVFCGSKNVLTCHKVGTNYNQKTNDLPTQIMNKFLEVYYSLTKEQQHLFIDRTMIFEYMYEHGMFYNPKIYIVFFDCPPNSGLPTVKVLEEYSESFCLTVEQEEKLHNLPNEGVVVKYINTQTGDYISEKLKGYFYIINRATREHLKKRHKSVPLESCLKELTKILSDKNSNYIKLSPQKFEEHLTRIREFVTRLYASKWHLNDLDGHKTMFGFGVIYHDLMDATPENPTKFPEGSEDQIRIRDLEFRSRHDSGSSHDLGSRSSHGHVSTPFDPTTFLVNPNNFTKLLVYIKQNNKCFVILKGLPRTGKSSLCEAMIKFCEENKISLDICSADHYFTDLVSGQYNFDQSKLNNAHTVCKDKAKSSQSQVVIIDNTNLVRDHLHVYVNIALDKKYSYIVLQTITPKTEKEYLKLFTSRYNPHEIPEHSLKNMFKTITQNSAWAVLHGVMVQTTEIQRILDTIKQNVKLEGKVHHITCKYDPKIHPDHDPKVDPKNDPYMFKEITGQVVGYYSGIEGVALLVDRTSIPNMDEKKTCHITLVTNKGFEAAVFGKIPADKYTGIDTPVSFTGIYAQL